MEEWWIFPVVFLAAAVSSYIGALVGGGSLIITAVLLALGMPSMEMVGNRRFAAIGGNVGAWLPYHKAGKVDYLLALMLLPLSVGGLLLGYYGLKAMQDHAPERIIAFILIGLLGLKMYKDGMGKHTLQIQNKKLQHIIGGTGAVFSGLINNLTGAGGGMILVFGIHLGYGKNLLRTAGTAKFILLMSNGVAAIMFSAAGYISWDLMGVMMAGHFLGGWLGARFFLQRGDTFLRYVFYLLVIGLIVRQFL